MRSLDISQGQCDQASKERFGAAFVVKGGSNKAGVKEPRRKHTVDISLPSPWPQECSSPLAVHEALIAPSGKVEKVWGVKSPCPQVDRAISAAVQQWEYAPTVIDGKAVPVCIMVSTMLHPR
ncbi:MAG: energy transducer TonB [Vicinamibacteria bacterium]|nr:energy transducer TonB [Vicinamibacteria bacterium]